MKCSKCGSELKVGQKFCTQCGTPVNATPESPAKQMDAPSTCPKCGSPIKPGQKFCTKCGSSVATKSEIQVSEKGRFSRHQAQKEENAAVEDAERERARDRRNREAIDGIDVVRGHAFWNVQPGQVARMVTESEFNEIEGLKGVIIQEGCTALVYVDGELVGSLSGGAYTFPKKSEAEKKAEREEAERKVDKQEKKDEGSFMERGVVGTIGRGLSAVRRFLFGTKKGETEQKRQARQQKVDKILKSKAKAKLIRVYLVSDRILKLTFGGKRNEDGGIDYVPFIVPTKVVDVEIGVSLQIQVTNINDFVRNFLVDQSSLTTNQLQRMLNNTVENTVKQMLRNLDYQQDGLPEPVVANLGNRIQHAINEQLQGMQCIKILQITDRSADFERFRAVERELYCSEKELGFLQRSGEFRNRLAAETNKQEIDKATSEEDLRYALQQINRDQLLHDDEMEQFVLLLGAQKRLREAKSQEEEYEALIDIKKSRLVKDDEMAALEDALAQNKIQRDSVTEIMRIQHQQSIDDARLKAQWALDDQKQDHDWEREDLQRRRDWGIEDEQREREWMHEEQEYNRNWNRTQQEEEYEWQKRIRETDLNWQEEERRREAEWQQRQREHDLARQDKIDDVEILARKVEIAQRLKDAQLREMQEQNRSTEAIHGMDVQEQMNRDNNFANMSAEQIRAAQLSHLSEDAQVAMANAYSTDGEAQVQKELYEKMLQMQQAQGAQSQEMMMKMAQMMQQGMMGVSGAQLAAQEQRADEYKEDARHQQERMDHTLDQSLHYTTLAHQADAMGPRSASAQPQQPSSAGTASPQMRRCPACGAEVPDGEAFCGECGNRM